MADESTNRLLRIIIYLLIGGAAIWATKADIWPESNEEKAEKALYQQQVQVNQEILENNKKHEQSVRDLEAYKKQHHLK
jgi:hypothetical protein